MLSDFFRRHQRIRAGRSSLDIVLNHSDLPLAIPALESVGFLFRQSSGVTMFLDGKDAKARDAVHVVIAGENEQSKKRPSACFGYDFGWAY